MRFCPKCNGDVEASKGYCLLGHRLALDPPVSSIAELRAEIDKAFEDAPLVAAVASGGAAPAATPVAQSSVAVAPQMASGAVKAPVRPRRVGPPPPPPPRRPAAVVSVQASAPVSTPASAPGQVPTPEQIVTVKADVWKALEDDIDLAGDPISSFAPPPTMDWGPRESKLRRKPTRSLGRFKRSKDDADQT